MREKRRGYPVSVSIGYKKNNGRNEIIVSNIKDLENIQKNNIVIISGVGKRKKLEIVKKAKEMKIKIQNLNNDKFIKKNQKKDKEVKGIQKNKNKESKK